MNIRTEHLLYLLYACAYKDDDGTVTKGTVKSYLPKASKGEAEKIYDFLEGKSWITFSRRGRFYVTDLGRTNLIEGLGETDYKFMSSKGYKVVNELVKCVQESVKNAQATADISFEEFRNKFEKAYFEERKTQASQGVAMVSKGSLYQRLNKELSVSAKQFREYLDDLKRNGNISISQGRSDELIEWVE